MPLQVIHQKLCARGGFYDRWHRHPHHHYHHWLAFVLAFLIGAYAIASAWVVTVEEGVFVYSPGTAQAQACPSSGFYDNYDSCREPSSMQTVGCTEHAFETPAGWGSVAFKANTNQTPCNNTNRKYPDYKRLR
jgi:hypothetical protein